MVVCRVAQFAAAAGSNCPAPRCHHGICQSGSTVYVVGGEDGEGVFGDVWALDTCSGQWREIVAVNAHDFSGRQGCSCCVIDDKLFVIGGGDLLTLHLGAVLDLRTLRWSDLRLHGVLGRKPDARQHHACAAVAGGLVVHGGFNGLQHLGDTWLLDAASFTWRQLHASQPAPPCSNHCLVAIDEFTLLRIGGEASSHASTVAAQPLAIDFIGDGAWRPRPIGGAPSAPLSGCSAGWISAADGSRRLCVFGGWGDSAAAARCIAVNTAAWTAVEAAVKSPAHVEVGLLGAGALQLAGGGALLFGGWDGMFKWSNALLTLTLF